MTRFPETTARFDGDASLRRRLLLCLLLISTGLLTACGGSSTTASPPPPTSPPPPPPPVTLPDVLSVARTLSEAPAAVVQAFTVQQGGTYDITLTDTGDPTAGPPLLGRLNLLVLAEGNEIARLDEAGTRQVTLEAGDHTLHLIGVPTDTGRVGAAAVAVTDSSGANVSEIAAVFELPPDEPGGPADYQRTFDVTTAGNYALTIEDFVVPQAFASFDHALIRLDDFSVLDPEPAGSAEVYRVTQTGTYQLTVVTTLEAGVERGLYGFNFSNTDSSTTVFSETREVGEWEDPLDVAIPADGDYEFALADFGFPVPLAALQSALVADGLLLLGGGAVTEVFTASAGTALLYIEAEATSPPGAGSYGIRISDLSGAALLETVGAVEPDEPGGDPIVLDEEFAIGEAGDYTLRLTDFQFPAAVAELSAALTSNSEIVGVLPASGSVGFTAAPGNYRLFVFATTNQATDAGLVAALVERDSTGATVFERTTAVGALLGVDTVTIPSDGRYGFELTDQAFGANFEQLAIAVTQGATLLGQVLGGGTLPVDIVEGDYTINVIARPDATDGYGTYSLRVGEP